MLPLKDITVVSLEQAIAAPFASRQLADMGARVIKIERPAVGDFARGYDTRVNGLSSHFVWTNRSKESLTLDIKHRDANTILKALIAKADVFIQNLAPGASDRLGLSFEELHKEYPELIVCNISGYGNEGPYRDRKAYDLLIQSEAGFLSVTGSENEPAKAGISIADIAAGMYAYSNILTAIIQRQKTGLGCNIDISMLEALAEWMGYPMYYAYDDATPPPRAGASHATIYPYGPFAACDGKEVMLGLQNEREWQAFCRIVLENESLASDERLNANHKRSAHRQTLDPIIQATFNDLNAHEIKKRLDKAGIANADINDMAGLWAHPQLKARDRWRSVNTPSGPVNALIPPGNLTKSEPIMAAIPALGEHTERILSELGFADETIASLRDEGAI